MADLSDVSTDELRAALAAVDAKTPAQRLTAAIAHKNGVTQTELAEWFGVQRKTVYNWLARFDDCPGSLADAARDADRSGRPRRLTDEQLAELDAALRNSPAESGYDQREWTPALLRRHVSERWGVSYSKGHCRKLLAERR